jgi:type I restriction-modification system DNA methylase subunit
MGKKFMSALMKKFAQSHFPAAKNDFFACFVERALQQLKAHGRSGIVAPFVWMFLSSYKAFRERLIDETSLTSLIQLEYNAFEPAMVPVATFTLMRSHINNYTGSYIKPSEFKGIKTKHHVLYRRFRPECGNYS